MKIPFLEHFMRNSKLPQLSEIKASRQIELVNRTVILHDFVTVKHQLETPLQTFQQLRKLRHQHERREHYIFRR